MSDLYVGIDIGKAKHVAGIVSPSLLRKHRRFDLCPSFPFENSRQGFEGFMRVLSSYGATIHVLFEVTGHYHRALEEYLQDHDVIVYRVHVQKAATMHGSKSDKIDAQRLANSLYNQVCLGAQIPDTSQKARRVATPSQASQQLRGLVRHRDELVTETTRRKNKLIAICDELFPEYVEIFKDLNALNALHFRELFPTPRDIARAQLSELQASRIGTRPSKADLAKLQELAGCTIGVKDPSRVHALVFAQRQLLAELSLLSGNLAEIDAEIDKIVVASREGQILTSLPFISATVAGVIIAHVGTIENFESASQLVGFFGWRPKESQTGTTKNGASLSRGGNRILKKTLYLAAWSAIRADTEWRDLYERLVPLKCAWDERLKKYKGKNKVLGRICGQIIATIYALLKADHDLIAGLEPGEMPPSPPLYDRAFHRARRTRRQSVVI